MELIYFANLGGQLDKVKGTIRGVSIITEGEALGHDVEIDATTIDQIYELHKSEPLTAYWTHNDGEADIGHEVGVFGAFHKDGKQLRAHFTAFESFRKNFASRYDYLFELAEKAPRFGVSIAFSGSRAWKLEDGSEVPVKPGEGRPEKAVGKFPFARVTKVHSADFVREPAANQGLFSTRKLTSLLDGQDKFAAQLAELTEKLSASEAAAKAKDTLIADLTVKAETAGKTLETERATFATKETEFSTQKTALETQAAGLATQITALSADIEARKTDAAAKEAEFKAEMQKMNETLLDHGCITKNVWTAEVDHRATWAAIQDRAEKTRYFRAHQAEILRAA